MLRAASAAQHTTILK